MNVTLDELLYIWSSRIFAPNASLRHLCAFASVSKVNCGQVTHSYKDNQSAVCDGPWLVTSCQRLFSHVVALWVGSKDDCLSRVTLQRPNRQKVAVLVLHLRSVNLLSAMLSWSSCSRHQLGLVSKLLKCSTCYFCTRTSLLFAFWFCQTCLTGAALQCSKTLEPPGPSGSSSSS